LDLSPTLLVAHIKAKTLQWDRPEQIDSEAGDVTLGIIECRCHERGYHGSVQSIRTPWTDRKLRRQEELAFGHEQCFYISSRSRHHTSG
jgi:hypothetical protein